MNNETQRLYGRFAKEVLILGAATVLTSFGGIFFLPLVTKTLGAHDYGIWAQVQITAGLTSGVLCLGLPYALTRFLPAKTDRAEIRDDFYSVVCLVSIITVPFSLAVILSAGVIASTFFDGATRVVVIAGFLMMLQPAQYAYLYVLRAWRHMWTYSVLTVVQAYGTVGLVAYLALNGHGLSTMLIGSLAVQAAVLVILFSLVWRQIGLGRPSFRNMRQYLRFSLPTVPGNISWWVMSVSDRYVIAYLLGATLVGVYSAAYGLANILALIIGILGMVLTPALSKLYDEGNVNELATHLSYSLKYLLLLGIPFVFGAAVLAKPLLTLFSTPEIASQSCQVVPLLAASILLFGASVVIGTVLALVKKTAISGLIMVLAAAVNLGLNLILVPRVGITGSAVGILVANAFALGVGSYYSFKEFSFPIDWYFIIKSLIASSTMVLVIWLMSPQGSLETIVAVLVGVCVYGAALLLLRGVKKEEISFFRGLLWSSASTPKGNQK